MEWKGEDETRNSRWPDFAGPVSQDEDFDFYLKSNGKACEGLCAEEYHAVLYDFGLPRPLVRKMCLFSCSWAMRMRETQTRTQSQKDVRDTLIVQMYRRENLSPRAVKAPGLLRTLTVPS